MWTHGLLQHSTQHQQHSARAQLTPSHAIRTSHTPRYVSLKGKHKWCSVRRQQGHSKRSAESLGFRSLLLNNHVN
jgi:hypothetical protein